VSSSSFHEMVNSRRLLLSRSAVTFVRDTQLVQCIKHGVRVVVVSCDPVAADCAVVKSWPRGSSSGMVLTTFATAVCGRKGCREAWDPLPRWSGTQGPLHVPSRSNQALGPIRCRRPARRPGGRPGGHWRCRLCSSGRSPSGADCVEAVVDPVSTRERRRRTHLALLWPSFQLLRPVRYALMTFLGDVRD
jgi:hypothetical protein